MLCWGPVFGWGSFRTAVGPRSGRVLLAAIAASEVWPSKTKVPPPNPLILRTFTYLGFGAHCDTFHNFQFLVFLYRRLA